LSVVLHPSLKTQYFKDNKWLPEWEDEAIAITRKIFENEYRGPRLQNQMLDSAPDQSNPQQSSKVSELGFFATIFVSTDI